MLAAQAHTLPEIVLDAMMQAPDACFVGDSQEGWIANRDLLARAHRWAAVLRGCAETDEQFVGLLLPSSANGVAAALAVVMADRCPVFLNYTASREATEYAIANCGLKRILTFPAFAEAVSFPAMPLLTDLAEWHAEPADLHELLKQPANALQQQFFPNQGGAETTRPGTVLFSSGSTGTPKGVILTNHNLKSNLEDVFSSLQLNPDDIIFGFLPFFHSFGFLATLWLPLASGRRVFFHGNPTDAGAIAEIAMREKPSVMFATPTFLQMYMRRCPPEAFASLRIIVTGAEKMRTELSAAFHDRFGVLPVEGYGTTELSPVVSINLPEDKDRFGQDCGRLGAVGRPLPRVRLRTVDPVTGADVAAGEEGLLLVHGPNVMFGYLNDPTRTADVLIDGWYNTGDIARIDADGYLFITGRLSRFSKIAGEMIPHGAVEEAIQQAADSHALVVTGTPDPLRGERIVVLYTETGLDPKAVIASLRERGLPNLWIPKPADFHLIDAIPLLGSGKLDLRAINAMATEKSG